MVYGYVMDVPAPIEFYDAMHAEIGRRTAAAGGVDGMLLHVGRETRNGFQITEVWETKELYDRFIAGARRAVGRAASAAGARGGGVRTAGPGRSGRARRRLTGHPAPATTS